MKDNQPTGFYDNSKIDKIDREIKNHLARPTLVADLKKQNEKKNEVRNGLSWGAEWKKYWYVYIFLAISALFTGTLGIYMGLSPSLVTEADGLQYIHFNTDVGHVLLAIVYFIAFIGVTEAAFAIAKWKFYTREENNSTQHSTMITAMGIAGLSILLTGIAGGTVVASNIAFLSEFVNIPAAAQKWVVIAIPVLIVTYTILFTAYALSSAQAASERITNEMERERELDNKTRMNAIRQIATEKLQAAEIDAFERLVMAGLISSAEALAAIEAGRSLKQEELFLGRDLDGDNRIGDKPRPGIWVPEDEYQRLSEKYPEVPGVFIPDEDGEDAMKQAKAWAEVNQKLEEVKRDLLRARGMIEQNPTLAARPNNGQVKRS